MPGPPDILGAKILIVDNQPSNVVLLERLLRGAGYVSVTSTMDPREVGERHRKNHYDLILLDLQMPAMDGFEVMKGLKEIAPDGDLPVIVLSAQPTQKLPALKAGAKDFISQPYDLEEVLIRVRNLLEARLLRMGIPQEGVQPAPDRYFVPRTIAWIVATVGGIWLLYHLWKVVLLVIVTLVLVGTFNPILTTVEQRGLKRTSALIVLMFALSLVVGLLLFLSVPALIDQLTRIVADLPGQREQLIEVLGRHKFSVPLSHALSNVGLEQSLARLQTYLVGYWSDAVAVIGYGATAFCLSIYFLADGKRTQGALYAVVPRDYHMRLARIVHNLQIIVGGYTRGQMICSVSLAVFTFVLLTACGVRDALAIALFAGLMDVVPFVGGFLAAGPAALAALGRGPGTALVVLVGMWIYLEFETKILIPRVYGRALRLSPATVILALIIGGTLLGVLGALLALPIAAGLRMILEELGVVMPGDDSRDPSARARDRKTEAAYELMSAGSTAPDAGAIASELAHGLRDADAWVAASQARKK